MMPRRQLLLQAVPAEPIVQPATQDLRVILGRRATSRRRFAKIGLEVFKAERPLLARRVFDAAARRKISGQFKALLRDVVPVIAQDAAKG